MGARRRNPRPTVLEFASRRSLPSVTVRFTYADYIFVRCRLLSIAHVAVNVAVKAEGKDGLSMYVDVSSVSYSTGQKNGNHDRVLRMYCTTFARGTPLRVRSFHRLPR